jgi:hypothetical protein
MDLEPFFTSLIAHLPPAKYQEIPPIVDRLIDARNRALNAFREYDARSLALNREYHAREDDERLAQPRGQLDHAWTTLGNALTTMHAAAKLLADLCPIPVEWTLLGEMSGEHPLPEKKDNAVIVEVLTAFRDFMAGNGVPRQGKAGPLTDDEQSVLDLIAAQTPGRGITGKEICRETGILQSTLTSRIIPNLNQRGHRVENRRGAGYYLAPPL